MNKLINRLLRYEKIDGNGACPRYLERWHLLKCGKLFSVYLHHFLGDDWAIDPHDHPKRFISIGLWGWYHEWVYDKDGEPIHITRYQAPWFRTFPPDYIHRIEASKHGNVWTLVIVLRHVREWGFIQDGKWIHWKQYVFGGVSRKSC